MHGFIVMHEHAPVRFRGGKFAAAERPGAGKTSAKGFRKFDVVGQAGLALTGGSGYIGGEFPT